MPEITHSSFYDFGVFVIENYNIRKRLQEVRYRRTLLDVE